MKVKKLKRTSRDADLYATYCFRLTPPQRTDLQRRLRETKARLNKSRKAEEKVIKLNEIILEALRIGLPLIKIEN